MTEPRILIKRNRAAEILGVQRWRVTHWAKIGLMPGSAWFWRRGTRIYYEDAILQMKADVEQRRREYEARKHARLRSN